MKSKKLENLEKKFNLAQEIVDECEDLYLSDETSEYTSDIEVSETYEVIPSDTTQKHEIQEEMFELSALKQDFMMVRGNVISIVNAGQNILKQVQVLDLGDLKASQLDALSNLQRTLGDNLKLLITLYKDIIDIEKSKRALQNSKSEKSDSMVSAGNGSTQNIIFAGGTHDILDLINNKGKKEDE